METTRIDKSREAPVISVLHGCEEVGGKVYALSPMTPS